MPYWLKPVNWGRGQWLVLAAVVISVAIVLIGASEKPNRLAAAILQAVAFVLGVYGSYALGQQSARDAAREMVRPHAASAFRRMLNLYKALGRVQTALSEQQRRLADLSEFVNNVEVVRFQDSISTLSVLSAMVVEQIATADDAINDWRDLAPDEVARVEAAAQEGR